MEKEKLENRMKELQGLLRSTSELGAFEQIVAELEELKGELKALNLKNKVDAINKEAKEKREFIEKILSLGPIDRNIFTNDMSLHKTKRQKAPELYAMKESEEYRYMYFSISHSGTLCIHYNRLSLRFVFETTRTEYRSCLEPNIQHAWTSAEEAFEAHNIPLKDIKASEVLKCVQKLGKQLEKVKQETAVLDKVRSEGRLFELNGLLKQRSETYYYTELISF